MKKITRLLCGGALIVASLSTVAGSLQYGVYGAGIHSCGSYVQAFRTGDPTTEKNFYMAWLGGYLTAYNNMSKTGNLAGGTDIYGPVEWINSYCQKNPMSNVANAAFAFINFMASQEELSDKNKK